MTAAMAARAAAKPRTQVRYEVVFWIFFIITTGLFVADRFSTNVWPRQWFGLDRAGNDKVDGLAEGPWGVKLYDIVARVSGRVSMATLNGLLFTMMHTLFNWLSERPNSWIDFSGWQEANERIHVILAIGTCLLLVPHVWSPFFPVWFHGYDVEIVWPDSNRSKLLLPVSEWIQDCKTVSSKTESICLEGGDDIGRLIGMTLMMGMLFPLTRLGWALRKNWMLCKWVHVVMAGLYAFDLLRRRTHPHAWVLNAPFVIAYFIDRVLAWYFYRVGACEVVGRLPLDDGYSVVYWRMNTPGAQVGDLYFMKAHDQGGKMERLHPFTCMSNRTGEFVPTAETASPSWAHHALVCDDMPLTEGIPVTTQSWDVAAIVKVVQEPRRTCCGMSQTPLIASEDTTELDVCGPYRSAYASLSSLEALPEHTVIVASGSGGGLVVDFANAVQGWEAERAAEEREPFMECEEGDPVPKQAAAVAEEGTKKKKVTIVYTTRSVALLQFVTDRLMQSDLLEIDTTHVALTTEGAEFDAERGPMSRRQSLAGGMSGLPSPQLPLIVEGLPPQHPSPPASPPAVPSAAPSPRLRELSLSTAASPHSNRRISILSSTNRRQSLSHTRRRSMFTLLADELTAITPEGVSPDTSPFNAPLATTVIVPATTAIAAASDSTAPDARAEKSNADATAPDMQDVKAGADASCTVQMDDYDSEPNSRRMSLTLGRTLHGSTPASFVGLKTTRLSLDEILAQVAPGAHVFFCGSGTLLKIVSKACKTGGLVLHDSHEFEG